MKNILIATDFSDASRNATRYGLEFAKATDAKAVLFHAFEVPVIAPDSIAVTAYGDIKKIAEAQMKAELIFFQDEGYSNIEAICEEGVSADAVIKKARSVGAGLIIAGIKGAGKGLRKIFGSTVTALAKHTDIPVLVVPEAVEFSVPESIVFANDILTGTDIHVIDTLKAIVEKFHARLYIVKVVKNKTEEWHEVLNTPETLLMAVRQMDSQFDYPVNKNIVEALNAFSEEHHAKMIAMMPHKHFWSELLFSKSNTKDMVFHTKLPLLILPEKHYTDAFVAARKHDPHTEGLLM